MDGVWLVLGSSSNSFFAAAMHMFTNQLRGGDVKSSPFGDAFSFEHVKFEVLVGMSEFTYPVGSPTVDLPISMELGIINLYVVTEAADDIGST